MAKHLPSRDPRRRPRHALLAAEPAPSRQTIAGARRKADHDSADGRASAATGAAPSRFWVITNDHLRARDPAPASATAERARFSPSRSGAIPRPPLGWLRSFCCDTDPDAVLGLFPSDHVIGDEKRYRPILKNGNRDRGGGREHRSAGDPPHAPGDRVWLHRSGSPFQGDALRVRRFTEKPDAARAAEFVQRRKLFLEQRNVPVERAHPGQRAPRAPAQNRRDLEQIAATFGTRKFAATFARLYPKCENISIDYAVLEPRSAKGEQNSNIILPSRRFRVERSGLVDRAARTPCREGSASGRQSGYRQRASSRWTPTETTFTRRESLWRRWE